MYMFIIYVFIIYNICVISVNNTRMVMNMSVNLCAYEHILFNNYRIEIKSFDRVLNILFTKPEHL